MDPSSVYDVLVIGAGPAGGNAAYHAARRGLKTILVEEHAAIGEPVHCGECLSEMTEIRCGVKFPKEVIALPVNGVQVIFPDSHKVKLTEKGYVLEKQAFEKWLAARAQDAGSHLSLSTRVTGLTRTTGEWDVDTSQGKIRSKMIIDGSGAAGVGNRMLQLNPRFGVTTGIQYELLDIPQEGYLDFYLWPRLAPEGYLWMIPKNDGRANVGLVTHDIPKAKIYLDQFVKEMGWEGKAKVKTFGGPIPSSGPVKNTYADGILLIGDAAGFTSPLFEGGTQLGMVSGQMAAEVAKDALTKGDVTKAGLSLYEKKWKAEFPSYDRIIQGKKALYNFTDAELNRIGRLMPAELSDLSTLDKAKVGYHVLTRNYDLYQKGIVDAFLAFGYSRAAHYGW
ncbi:MAG: NAD(P)/FAD-dependent oxidoreductase [Candidatus Diapherotrites archaeon]|nr:NAD(P)/FAD-dependent oxidoreductase [Candidatus Diapherotrites archaeon]MDZ4256718.1 NAD(P)/FAD-dependent oxidoreductase [archaeon]